jgi:Protein of unknown function (DUF2911)
MKNLLFIAILVAGFTTTSIAQHDNKVAPSPACTVSQTVGLTDFTIEYSRPGMKDRTVFGDLVPYGEMWRAGANAVTKFTCSTDVNVGGADLKAGEYAVLVTPEKDAWTIHFYPYEGNRWPAYRDGDVKPIDAKTSTFKEMPWDVESYMIFFNNLRDESATLHFVWERTNAVVPVTVSAAPK